MERASEAGLVGAFENPGPVFKQPEKQQGSVFIFKPENRGLRFQFSSVHRNS